MKISLRGWCVLGMFATVLAVLALASAGMLNAADSPSAASGQLTESSLGNLLSAVGLKPKKTEKRYDFNFRSKRSGEEWELSMSAVLSENGHAVWLMAWLDELPRSSADVPRTALLRMLAENDRLGKGKFFAYVAGNRRFVLQRVIPNEGITTTSFRNALIDLGNSVSQSYPIWAVSNWKSQVSPPTSKSNSAAKSPIKRTSSTSNQFRSNQRR